MVKNLDFRALGFILNKLVQPPFMKWHVPFDLQSPGKRKVLHVTVNSKYSSHALKTFPCIPSRLCDSSHEFQDAI